MRVIWAPRAVQRAIEIARYIASDRPGAAAKWVDEIFAAAATLKRFPKRGSKAPETDREEIRQLFHKSYRLIYRIETKQVVVLTIRHVRQLPDPSELEAEG